MMVGLSELMNLLGEGCGLSCVGPVGLDTISACSRSVTGARYHAQL